MKKANSILALFLIFGLVLFGCTEETVKTHGAGATELETGETDLEPAGDEDSDGVFNKFDNCPTLANPTQIDFDDDGIGDECDNDRDGDGVINDNDNCLEFPNEDQVDTDKNGIGDRCEEDDDGDAWNNMDDNCPSIANSEQIDTDQDGLGDVCDDCANDFGNDSDDDGVCGDVDNCANFSNPDQEDADLDMIGDPCDEFPYDFDNDGLSDAEEMECESDYQDAASTCEICDGIDNDLNDGIDEGYGVGIDCDSDDSDRCENGTFTCTTDGLDVECLDETEIDIVEVCNYEDDDCDESIDEEVKLTFYKDQDGDDFGDISKTEEACEASPGYVSNHTDCAPLDGTKWQNLTGYIDSDGDGYGTGESRQVCSGETLSSEYAARDGDNCSEVPNPKQEDADGDTLGDACDDFPNDFDNDGLTDEEEISCDSDPLLAASTCEICDGLDNDLNDGIDEDWPVDELCDSDDSDFCKNGTYTCTEDRLDVECVNETERDIVELCNGDDDDCDEEYDEDFDTLDDPCDGTDTDKCFSGSFVCNEEETGVECYETEHLFEICNGEDDDCDGTIDEGFDDTDLDSVADCVDNCILVENPDQGDVDEDGLGNACDLTIELYTAITEDPAQDKINEAIDVCLDDCIVKLMNDEGADETTFNINDSIYIGNIYDNKLTLTSESGVTIVSTRDEESISKMIYVDLYSGYNSNVEIAGLRINGNKEEHPNITGIHAISRGNNIITIKDNEIFDCEEYGIYAFGYYYSDSNIFVENNEIHDNKQGVYARIIAYSETPAENSSIIVSDNKIFDSEEYGIYALVSGASNSVISIENNEVYQNKQGVYSKIDSSSSNIENSKINVLNNEIYNNVISGGVRGLITAHSLQESPSSITIKNNSIHENIANSSNAGGVAAAASGSYGNISVINNIIYDNKASSYAGGGISAKTESYEDCSNNKILILNNAIDNNDNVLSSAIYTAGGVFIRNRNTSSTITLTNNLITNSQNRGGINVYENFGTVKINNNGFGNNKDGGEEGRDLYIPDEGWYLAGEIEDIELIYSNINCLPFYWDEELHVSASSCSVNVGENSVWDPIEEKIDKDGRERRDGIIDLGAYEIPFAECVTDEDGDGDFIDEGICGPADCDDADASRYHGAEEVCDGVDNNCDDLMEGESDSDKDGYMTCEGDCDDTDYYVNPGAEEVCDGIDNDCDGETDEGFLDTDGDFIADCVDPDDDEDTWADGEDNCPLVPNKDQRDIDGDRIGLKCDNKVTITPDMQYETYSAVINEAILECPEGSRIAFSPIEGESEGIIEIDDPIIISNRSIILEGEPERAITILNVREDGSSSYSMIDVRLDFFYSDTVEVSGLNIDGNKDLSTCYRGIEIDYIRDGDKVVIDNNKIFNCNSDGIYARSYSGSNSEILIKNNDIHDNEEGIEAKIDAPSSSDELENSRIRIIGNTIYENERGVHAYLDKGQGASENDLSIDIVNNTIYRNMNSDGAGIRAYSSTNILNGQINILNNTIDNNRATSYGGGVYIRNNSETSVISLTNNLITNTEDGGGIYVSINAGTMEINYNGFGNNKDGSYEDADLRYDGQWYTADGMKDLDDIDENIFCIPFYWDVDRHVTRGCNVDVGDKSAWDGFEEKLDKDGNDRIQGAEEIVDLGAYELPETCGVDADGDGFEDGYCGGVDCDDTDPEINPGADELSDGIDNNCDGIIDDTDGDEIDDEYDNCDEVVNPDQRDIDGDGIGLKCEDKVTISPNMEEETYPAVINEAILECPEESRIAFSPIEGESEGIIEIDDPIIISNRSIILEGEPERAITILNVREDGSSSYSMIDVRLDFFYSDTVKVSGLNINGNESLSTCYRGIEIDNAREEDRVIIDNNEIFNCNSDGIYAESHDGSNSEILIKNNDIHDNADGIDARIDTGSSSGVSYDLENARIRIIANAIRDNNRGIYTYLEEGQGVIENTISIDIINNTIYRKENSTDSNGISAAINTKTSNGLINILNNTIDNNKTVSLGGGIYISNSSETSAISLTNNLITNTQDGGGIHVSTNQGTLKIKNNGFGNNRDGSYEDLDLRYDGRWYTASEMDDISTEDQIENNIFCIPSYRAGDLHVIGGSCNIDAGDSAMWDEESKDKDGNNRVQGVAVDLGAYEMPETCVTDADSDGYFTEGDECGPVDCDDGDLTVNPGVFEGPFYDAKCTDEIDNDCDGLIDIADEEGCFCADVDGDGFEDAACYGEDCDDTDAAIHPDAAEISDEIDNNCDGIIDDTDGDGIMDDVEGLDPCTGGAVVDCDDNCPLLDNPDQDDFDGDGVGTACDQEIYLSPIDQGLAFQGEINNAISLCSDGAIIILTAADIDGIIEIDSPIIITNKSVTLKGEPERGVTIVNVKDGGYSYSMIDVRLTSASPHEVAVSGLNIDGNKNLSTCFRGIEIDDIKDEDKVVIENNEIFACSYEGIYAQSYNGSHNEILIQNNDIHDNEEGIEARIDAPSSSDELENSRIRIIGNAIYENERGIYAYLYRGQGIIENTASIEIINNTIYQNMAYSKAGIYAYSSANISNGLINILNNTIDNNKATSHGGGVYISNHSETSVISLTNNLITNTEDGGGIYVAINNGDLKINNNGFGNNKYDGDQDSDFYYDEEWYTADEMNDFDDIDENISCLPKYIFGQLRVHRDECSIDAGFSDVWDDDAIDKDGNDRVQGDDVDLGAYEVAAECTIDDDSDDFFSEECGGYDCDDAESEINPEAEEMSDGMDNNCDGIIDDTDGDTWDDEFDNCDEVVNPDQRDIDKDGQGVVCDQEISISPGMEGETYPDVINEAIIKGPEECTIKLIKDPATGADTFNIADSIIIEDIQGRAITLTSEEGVIILNSREGASDYSMIKIQLYPDSKDNILNINGLTIDGNESVNKNSRGIYILAGTNNNIFIKNNEILRNHYHGDGAGIFAKLYYEDSNVFIEKNTISNNHAQDELGNMCGGGIYSWVTNSSNIYILNNIIYDNDNTRTSAYGDSPKGGGACFRASDSAEGTGLIANNTFHANSALRGGGLYITNESSAFYVSIINNLFTENSSAIYSDTEPTILDAIAYNGFKDNVNGAYCYSSAACHPVEGEDAMDLISISDLIFSNKKCSPNYINPEIGDLHLGAYFGDDKCIDEGFASMWDELPQEIDRIDIDGDDRQTCGQIDLGADEVTEDLFPGGECL